MWKWPHGTDWTFQQSSELGGGVVNKGSKKKSRERAIGRNREGGKKGRGKKGHTTFHLRSHLCSSEKYINLNPILKSCIISESLKL